LKRGESIVRERILIVDDDVDVAQCIATMLEAAGAFEIRRETSAANALAAAETFAPAIVFLDIELPDMRCHDVARLMSQQVKRWSTRLIAITGSIEHPWRAAARAAGFECFLMKPVTEEALGKVLRRRVRIHD
jgi:two-component system CheB/CheR fusion protein